MNYPDSVHFLYSLGNEIKTAKLGLDRVALVLDALGRPQERTPFVHVAGTNGKGSTCAMIEAALRAAGRRTGLFTSPHLAEPTERIRIAGEQVSAREFAALFDRVHRAVEGLIAAGTLETHTTYFETVTAMALVAFAEAACEMVVLEVGLGGRLDATNVVRPRLCVITPVDFDHEAWLGRSLEAIAGEKAGILKPGVPAVMARQRPEAAAVIEARAAELGIPLARVADWRIEQVALSPTGSRFLLRGEREFAIECPLAGAHQVDNAATAAMALDRLGLPAADIERGIAAARWPGRLERICERPEILVDGAHNPAGAAALAAHLDRFYRDRDVTLIFGAMRDKAIDEIGGLLFPRARRVILTAPRQARAAAPEAVLGLVEHSDVRVA
ncbi:MAG: bifunctional folylpolyglutamate synthase/dihydrofolate synthase, partial [Acidobacteriota bacterium]|nr:bifunctional folylpolyglutamate synthase/dihydrofolate synthase [Acidobacteriota bacterium]